MGVLDDALVQQASESPFNPPSYNETAGVTPKSVSETIGDWARNGLPEIERALKSAGGYPRPVADLNASCKTIEGQFAQLAVRLEEQRRALTSQPKKSAALEKEIKNAMDLYRGFLLNSASRIVVAEIDAQAQRLSQKTQDALLGSDFLGLLKANLQNMIHNKRPASNHPVWGVFFEKINVVWKDRMSSVAARRDQTISPDSIQKTLADFRRHVFEQLRGHFSFGYKKALREIASFYNTLEETLGNTIQDKLDATSVGLERRDVFDDITKKLRRRLPELFLNEISKIQDPTSWTETVKELKEKIENEEIDESIARLYVEKFLASQKEVLKTHGTKETHQERMKVLGAFIQKLKSPPKETNQGNNSGKMLSAIYGSDPIKFLFEDSEMHGKLRLLVSLKRVGEGKNTKVVNNDKITDEDWKWLGENIKDEYRIVEATGLNPAMSYLLGNLLGSILKQIKKNNPYKP